MIKESKIIILDWLWNENWDDVHKIKVFQSISIYLYKQHEILSFGPTVEIIASIFLYLLLSFPLVVII